MKTTSFEISKKLAELGIKLDSPINISEKEWSIETRNEPSYPTYDLQTILEALPMGIDRVGINGEERRFDLIIEQRAFLCYTDEDGNEILPITSKLNESLVDAAARLLIRLAEEDRGLILCDPNQ